MPFCNKNRIRHTIFYELYYGSRNKTNDTLSKHLQALVDLYVKKSIVLKKFEKTFEIYECL